MGNHAEDAKAEYSTTYDDIASESELIRIIHDADSMAAKSNIWNRKNEQPNKAAHFNHKK